MDDRTLCTACNRREAVFFRPYSGEKICKKCFLDSVEKKVRTTIAKHQMLKYSDKIAVAVSGGKDSASLLTILAKLERNYPKASLVSITIDEGIGGYRDEALKIARKNCEKLGIEHYILTFKELFGFTLDEIVEKINARAHKGGGEMTPCAYCGVLRRKALNIAARNVNADKLVTAHTLDDETQTILLNIFRGDVSHLARTKPITDKIHPKLVQKIKPFCEILEKEVALYAYLKQLSFQSIPCPYAPEALRTDIRMMLNLLEEKHVGMKFTIFKSVGRMRPALEEAHARAVNIRRLRECTVCGEPTPMELCKTCQLLRDLSQ